MNPIVRQALEQFSEDWIQECEIIVINCDMTEITHYNHNVGIFKEAERFIETAQKDQNVLRCIYLVMIVKNEDSQRSNLVSVIFKKFNSALDFLAHMNWETS